MTTYLLVIAIGPVQGFIMAARRNRDLWSGSWLLSELAKAGAKSLHEQQAQLIFPYISNAQDLEPNSALSVGNKLQAVVKVDDASQLHSMVGNIKQAVQARFNVEANAALKALKYSNDIRSDIWHRQLKDYVEVQAVWAKISADYNRAVVLAGITLAARKVSRDFLPAATSPYQSELMLPKSSLDGMRETVIKENKRLTNDTRIRLSLSDSEQLDCAGVVKRLGFANQAEQFTPFTRITAHAWLQKLLAAGEDLSPIQSHYEALVTLGVATRVRGNQGIYSDFAYDAQLLYDFRLDAAIKQWRGLDDTIDDELKALKKVLMPLWRTYGQPYNYGVLLLADGDRMGDLLDKAKTQDEHKRITQDLSAFATGVAAIMRQYSGHCIYAGGDDVLGFVPLDTAYACADALRQSFSDALAGVSGGFQVATPTLSVGLAICHIMTPLGVIRELASMAEKHAKGDHCPKDTQRNALGLLLSVRSGTDIKLRLRWDDAEAHTAFAYWVTSYLNKAIPSRIAYDVRAIHLRTRLIAATDSPLQTKICIAELKRMLDRARTIIGDKIDKTYYNALTERAIAIGLDRLADELIVARWLAAKTQQDLGKE